MLKWFRGVLASVFGAWPVALAFLLTGTVWWWWWRYGAVIVGRSLAGPGQNLDLEALGQVGDLFGGINALFAAFAFAGVGVAAFFQYRSLKISEHQRTQQSFEPLFFHLLELHRQVATGMQLTSGSEQIAYPINIATNVYRDAIMYSTAIWMADSELTDSDRAAKIGLMYDKYYLLNEEALGPYFRSLYHIFKLIDRSEFDEPEKVEYANIARSTLSKADLFLLTLNCLSHHGKEFKPLVEKYGLLKHVSRNNFPATPEESIAWNLYEKTAVMSYPERQNYKKARARE